VGGGNLLLILLEPALLNGGGFASGGLALDLDLLALVGGKFAGKVGLLGRLGDSGGGELLDVLFSVTGLDGGRLESLELAEVKVLDGVGWSDGLANATDGYSGNLCNKSSKVPESVHTLADGGGQEGAASDRDLLPRGTGEEGALQFTLSCGST
jgi:hypothetical protein